MVDVLVDSVRASRDGHQFHEAWVARRALGLLLFRNELCAIAVEGLSEEDEEDVSGASVEVADATFYFGNGASFEACSRIEIANSSIRSRTRIERCGWPMRERRWRSSLRPRQISLPTALGRGLTKANLFAQHQPAFIGRSARRALRRLDGRAPTSKDGKSQLDQLCAAVPLAGDGLRSFASR